MPAFEIEAVEEALGQNLDKELEEDFAKKLHHEFKNEFHGFHIPRRSLGDSWQTEWQACNTKQGPVGPCSRFRDAGGLMKPQPVMPWS
ncbi:hypothetical protein NUTIK01_09090 [Novosphingobium sp. IK01]|uniref:Uncharacterized protein n=1 Tax=Novosphingobium pituita TaxID=3056842 RepID=A0ABQ6P6Y6_9SPHN|nr:hypothetical protein NUTIK01_09090 [Novosphingobium sp. IK01]